MNESYGSNYYERGEALGLSLYTSYRWMPECTIAMAAALCEQLPVPRGAKVLDFGCAKGYLVKALRLLGREAWGFDVSDYAVSQAPQDVREFLRCGALPATARFDWALCKDVLEHIPEEELRGPLGVLRIVTRRLWAVVPLGEDGRYVIPAYENDVTHRIRQPIGWWCNRLAEAGFEVESARYSMPGVKENWRDWPEGNGFIVCR